MSEYTPTLLEVRSIWCAFSDYGGLVDRPSSGLWDDRLAELDRWHAAEIRTARVKELREVADFIQEVRGRYWSTDDEMASLELDRECVEQMSAWLYHRADSIEAAS